ncbi:malonate decarboxylase holo-[acyl-carrier-protein] synthase [Robbsia andropogonis]|uniref:malonate decarboxylase holo-[acyl-carrier-protein] synthase n=1 Tax=Robbsia andropogonis TaxID=28092 RepID=UPI003D20F189
MHSRMTLSDAVIARHTVVRVSHAAWEACLATQPALANEPLIRDWVKAGRPLMARRANACDAAIGAGVPLGLPLPPSAGKRRISVVVPRDRIVSVAAPPTLASLVDVAPDPWRATIHALCALSSRHRVECRAFGSLAWQGLTSLPYLSAASDLDLLFDLPQGDYVTRTLDTLLSDIARCAAVAPMRIDGEIIRADGAGVNWRELHEAKGDVVVKRATDVVLLPAREFVEVKT